MAAASLTATVTLGDNTQRTHRIFGTIAIAAGSTYVTGGIALKAVLAALVDYFSSQPLLWIDIQGISGYIYQYNAATGKMLVLVGGAAASLPSAEFANSGALTGPIADTITFRCEVLRYN